MTTLRFLKAIHLAYSLVLRLILASTKCKIRLNHISQGVGIYCFTKMFPIQLIYVIKDSSRSNHDDIAAKKVSS